MLKFAREKSSINSLQIVYKYEKKEKIDSLLLTSVPVFVLLVFYFVPSGFSSSCRLHLLRTSKLSSFVACIIYADAQFGCLDIQPGKTGLVVCDRFRASPSGFIRTWPVDRKTFSRPHPHSIPGERICERSLFTYSRLEIAVFLVF